MMLLISVREGATKTNPDLEEYQSGFEHSMEQRIRNNLEEAIHQGHLVREPISQEIQGSRYARYDAPNTVLHLGEWCSRRDEQS